MYHSFIGERLRQIRTEVFDENQISFSEELNTYIKLTKSIPLKEFKHFKFSQNTISLLEGENRITFSKLTILLNFIFERKRVNPSWVILENNKSQPKFLKKLPIDKNLVEIHEEISDHQKAIEGRINDLRIIIENSSYVN